MSAQLPSAEGSPDAYALSTRGPFAGTPQAISLGLLVRRLAILVVASLWFLLPGMVDDPVLKETIPYFVPGLLLYLAPVLWPADSDLAAPVSLGLQGGLRWATMIAYLVERGRIELAFVPAMDADERAALTRMTLLLLTLSQAAYLIGYYRASWGAWWLRLLPKPAPPTWDRGRFRMVVGGFLLIFAAAYAAFQVEVGGSPLDLAGIKEGRAVFREDPTLSWMLRGIDLGLIPLFLLFVDQIPRARGARLVGLGLMAVLTAVLLVRTGTRTTAFIGLYIVLVFVHQLRRRVPIWFLSVVLITGVAVGNLLHDVRTGLSDDLSGATLANEQGEGSGDVPGILAKFEGEREALSVVALVLYQIPRNYPYLLGESWLALLVAPIPRWLWPEKSQYFRWRDNSLVYELGGGLNPSPLQVLLFANFSWLGMIIGMLLWGSFHRGLYLWLQRHQSNKSAVIMFQMLLFFFVPTVSGMNTVFQYVLPIWLILKFIARAPKATATA